MSPFRVKLEDLLEQEGIGHSGIVKKPRLRTMMPKEDRTGQKETKL